MRLIGPYGIKGMGAVSVGDEFIVGRTGFSVNRFDYGISEAIGARPTMEDRTTVIQSLMYEPRHGYYKNEPKDQLQELAMTSFAAVFDGHGGDECSNYLVDALPHHIRGKPTWTGLWSLGGCISGGLGEEGEDQDRQKKSNSKN